MNRWSKALESSVDAAKIDAGWQRVRARRARPRLAQRAVVVGGVVALAAVLVLVVRSWLAHGETGRAVTLVAPPLAPIALAGGGALPAEWSAAAETRVPLDDGSRLEMAPATRLVPRKAAPERVELSLENGQTTFDVKPGGARAWLIDAGDVRVEVIGTRFTVTRSGSDVTVSVEHGRVKVTDATGVRFLGAGERFAHVTKQDDPSRGFTAAEPAPSPAPPVKDVPRPATKPVRVEARASAEPPAPIAPAATADVDPMTRADALRKEGRSADAVAILKQLVDAGDARASLAAFTLGKTYAAELHDPALAGRWFERAVALGLPSGLDEEAQARAVECFAKAGSRAEAERAASRYEARFPNGRRRAEVKAWVGTASSP